MPRAHDEQPAMRTIVRIAHSLLLGELSVIEAAPQISAASRVSELLEWDDDVVTFRGIESETDVHLIGDHENGWHPDVRDKRLAEKAAAETFYRERALVAASNLVAKFGPIVG